MGAGSPKVHESALVRMLCKNQPLFQLHAKSMNLWTSFRFFCKAKAKKKKHKWQSLLQGLKGTLQKSLCLKKCIHEEETWLQSDLTSSAWFVCIVMELVPWGWLFGVHEFEVQRCGCGVWRCGACFTPQIFA
jgi:hypothetical protein